MEPRPKSEWPGQPLTHWVRWALLCVALGLVGIFAIAAWINPYGENGQAQVMATHRQLGLPPCDFYMATRLPCPSCGMTTSFALAIRADVLNALRANWVGFFLAGACLVFIPWGVASAVLGRTLFVRRPERLAVLFAVALFVLLLVRWMIVLGARWWGVSA